MVVERVFRVAFIGLLNGGEGVHGERGETERGLIGKFISRCSAVIVDDVCRTAMPTRQLKMSRGEGDGQNSKQRSRRIRQASARRVCQRMIRIASSMARVAPFVSPEMASGARSSRDGWV